MTTKMIMMTVETETFGAGSRCRLRLATPPLPLKLAHVASLAQTLSPIAD